MSLSFTGACLQVFVVGVSECYIKVPMSLCIWVYVYEFYEYMGMCLWVYVYGA